MHRTSHPYRLQRATLRHAAVRYAAHGWDVVPGACLSGSRFVCGRPGCPTSGCHPAVEHFEGLASHDPALVARWWRRRPYTVLLATGRSFDVIETPAYLGAAALDRLAGRDPSGPLAVTPAGRWMFLVRPGQPLRPELAARGDLVRHGTDSWIPAPPSAQPEGRVRWEVAPTLVRWRLPDPYDVQEVLVAALRRYAPRLLAHLY